MFQNKVDSLHEQGSVTEEQVHGKTVTISYRVVAYKSCIFV